jgi:hypothetical protein
MDSRALSLVPDLELCALRRCSKCEGFFSPVHFHKNKAIGADGMHLWCKQCRCNAEKSRRVDPEWLKHHAERRQADLPWRAREALRIILKRCAREGWEFDLDEAWVLERFEAGACEISGLNLDFSSRRGAYTPSIDRKTSSAGYTKRNCRVVLWCVNSALNNWGLEAFLPVAIAIAEKHRP